MKKKKNLRMTLRSPVCEAIGGGWRRWKITAVRDDSSFMEKCPYGQFLKWDWMGLGREVMPELEGCSM